MTKAPDHSTFTLAEGCSPSATPCAECGAPLGPGRRLFCSRKCTTSFHNRHQARGLHAIPLLQAWCMGRGGGRRGMTDTARFAMAQLTILARRWNEEDQVAGRMSMSRYVEISKIDTGWRACDLA